MIMRQPNTYGTSSLKVGFVDIPVLCCKPPRYVPYKCTYVPYNGTFGASDQRSDARHVRWHSADINPRVAVTGEVTNSAQHEILNR
jgi:hypothetical protein